MSPFRGEDQLCGSGGNVIMEQLKIILEKIAVNIINFMPKLISGAMVFLVFLVITFLVGLIFSKLMHQQKKERCNVLILLRRLSRSAIIIFGLITMLGIWGVDVSALVSGLGLTGFALGFAFKDAISSTLAGMLVLLYEPFEIGDVINVCGVQGKVMSIDMRYTTLQDNDTRHLVPNAKLFKEKVSLMFGN